MRDNVFYVISFDSTSHAIQTEKLIKEHFKIATIPTPREITHSCGLSIKINSDDLERIKSFFETIRSPCSLYSLSTEKIDGKREVHQIASN